MNSARDMNTDGPARRRFWVAGITAVMALALAPLSFHVERRLDTAVRLEKSLDRLTSCRFGCHNMELIEKTASGSVTLRTGECLGSEMWSLLLRTNPPQGVFW
jgi:hypothetical protein